jgi:prepilin signal peptidase PulO-like enzyme (type II secretory pathway)
VATCIVILIAVDLKHYYIPDPIQVTLCILGIGYGVIAYDTFLEPLYGAIIFAAMGFALRLLGYALKKTESLGWGDVKFFGVAGLFLGLDMTKTTLFFLLSGIMGIITALLWKRLGKGDLFPFGPALASALFIILLIPEINNIVPLISNYLLLHFYAN